MIFGSLFAGIGGIDLGLERAGMRCTWQVEIDPFCRAVLAKHWPGVPRFDDVRNVGARELAPVDLISGGFPCQDISVAGAGKGIAGARSGLWKEFDRIIGELRPLFVVIENSPAILRRGLDVVLEDLSARGYNATWDCLPAEAFGAHHERDRFIMVAWQASNIDGFQVRFESKRNQWPGWRVRAAIGRDPEPLEHGVVDGWNARPALVRVVDGFPTGLDGARNRALGNSVVPQVAEYIGREIVRSIMELA